MNTLKKIGLTALGTSLVAGSAFAGEITASGDAGYTYSSEEVGVRTDEGYGFNHDITFSGNSTSAENSQRELKITVRFLTSEIRADGIKVVIHEKVCSDKAKLDCNINKIKSSIGNDIKLAILKKAALLKKESETKKKK